MFRFSFGLCLFVFLFFSAGANLAVADAKPDKVSTTKVGIILPLSGEAASLGIAIQNGIKLAIDQLNPNTRKRLEFIYEDDGLLAKNSIAAFNKLVATENIEVLVNASSGTSNVLAPLAQARGIPFIAIATDPKVSAGRDYVFNLWVTPEAEAATAIAEAQKRGYKKIARVVTIQDGALAIKSAFDRENKGQIIIVLDEEFNADVKDFKTYIAKLRQDTKIDAVMVVLLPGQCGVFAKQARQLGIRQDLMGFEMFEDINEVKASGGALVGQWYVNTDDPDSKFLDAYTKQYPEASIWGASAGYDSVLLIARAVEQGFKGSDINQFLATLKDFKGALGTYSATGDNRFSIPAAVKIVTKDGFETLYH